MATKLSNLVNALDVALGKPPFSFEPSDELLNALITLKIKLEESVKAGTLQADAGGVPEVKTTLPVLATAYPRGSIDPNKPNNLVFCAMIDCVVLAFPVITYTVKDLTTQALRLAPGQPGTVKLTSLTKGFTKEVVLALLYGSGVKEEEVKVPTRPPPKPKKGAPLPPPWAPPKLKAPPGVVAELALAYTNGLPADCKPFIYDIFVGHGRFADAVGDDDAAAAAVLDSLFPIIRATLHPLHMLRVLSPHTAHHFVTLAEDRPDVAAEVLAAAQSLSGLHENQAQGYRASLRSFLSEKDGERRLGEFIVAAVLCALVTRTHKLLAHFDSAAATTLDTIEAFPLTDAIPKLVIFGCLGYRDYTTASNVALVHCTESLVVMGERIGKLSKPPTLDLGAFNDALQRLMDTAMDNTTAPMEVSMALRSVMFLVDVVYFYRGASYPDDAPMPATKHSASVAANMPGCRAVGLALSLDCNRASGKHLKDFACVWLGHMLRTRSLSIANIMKSASTPLFIMPKTIHQPKGTKKATGGKNSTPTPTAAAPSALHAPQQDGLRVLLIKLLTTPPFNSFGIIYLARGVIQQLAVIDDAVWDPLEKSEVLAAVACVPSTEVAQFIVDEVLDEEDADTNPNSMKHLLTKAMLRHSFHPESTLSSQLAVEEDDLKWLAFVTSVEEGHLEASHSAAAAQKQAAADRLAAVRRSQTEYSVLKERIATEQAELASQREGKLQRQRDIAAVVQSLMEKREKDLTEALKRTKARRELALQRVQMLAAERRKREAAQQSLISEATKERRELQVSLKEYLVDTLKLDPVKVYPILAFLRTQIDSLSSDDVHEYLVTGNLSVPLDMLVSDKEEAEIEVLDEDELKSRVAKKYLRTHEGLDFWGGTIEFAPSDEHPQDLVTIATHEVPKGVPEEGAQPRYVQSFHRRVAPVLDSFDYTHYEEEGMVPPLAREALAVVVTRSVLDDIGFSDLTEALNACSSRGLLKVSQGVVELTPLGAAYHAPFAEADKSFQRIYEEKDAQLRRSIEAKKAEMQSRAASNSMFAE